jgi:hypothetical protein
MRRPAPRSELASVCPTHTLLRAQVLGALADGVDVRGVFFWTLTDNIEWHEGFHMKFGLYEWCPVKGRPDDGELVLREGSKALQQLHAAWPDRLGELRDYARQLRQQEGSAGPGGGVGAPALEAAGAGAEGGGAAAAAGAGAAGRSVVVTLKGAAGGEGEGAGDCEADDQDEAAAAGEGDALLMVPRGGRAV